MKKIRKKKVEKTVKPSPKKQPETEMDSPKDEYDYGGMRLENFKRNLGCGS